MKEREDRGPEGARSGIEIEREPQEESDGRVRDRERENCG